MYTGFVYDVCFFARGKQRQHKGSGSRFSGRRYIIFLYFYSRMKSATLVGELREAAEGDAFGLERDH
jgi:hypothetical protein